VTREIVEAARSGDQGAFMQLVRIHGDRLYAIAYRILRDADGARDALQDALVLAWRDIPKLRDPDRFSAWMQRILTNVCLAQASRERGRVLRIGVLEIDPSTGDATADVHNRDQLERGFKRLKPDERAILVLRHYAGYEPTEIAALMGIPAGTVRSRLHHAHSAMRAALEAEARLATVAGETA
jgi:RNA polymerase sigma-70 factor (ECF subfamily)